jgi:hypothetical protein
MLPLVYQLRLNSKFAYFPGVGGWVGGGWWVGGWVGGETKIKAKLSPAEAGAWAELGNMLVLHTCIQCKKKALLLNIGLNIPLLYFIINGKIHSNDRW